MDQRWNRRIDLVCRAIPTPVEQRIRIKVVEDALRAEVFQRIAPADGMFLLVEVGSKKRLEPAAQIPVRPALSNLCHKSPHAETIRAKDTLWLNSTEGPPNDGVKIMVNT